MLPERAIEELRKLRDQAGTPEVRREGLEHDAWKAKVDAVMKSALGADSDTLREACTVLRRLNWRGLTAWAVALWLNVVGTVPPSSTQNCW